MNKEHAFLSAQNERWQRRNLSRILAGTVTLLALVSLARSQTKAEPFSGMVIWGAEKQCKSASGPIKGQECDEIVVNGEPYRLIFHDNKTIAVTFGLDDGYLVADALIDSDSDRFLLEPGKWGVFGYKNAGGSLTGGKPIFQSFAENPLKIASKVESQARWSALFVNLGAMNATSTTQVSGQVYGSNGTYGTYNGTATAPNVAAQQRARATAAENTEAAASRAQSIIDMSLRSNTILPHTRVAGRVYFKKGKAEYYEIYMLVDKTVYMFAVKR